MKLMTFLRANDLELDQRLAQAFSMFPSSNMKDWFVFVALCYLNAISSRFFDLRSLGEIGTLHFAARRPCDIDNIKPDKRLESIITEAVALSKSSKTLGTRNFLRVLLDHCFQYATRDERECGLQPTTLDSLACLQTHDPGLIVLSRNVLDAVPALKELLASLKSSICEEEDFQYILALEGNRIVFRVVSVLNDYVQTSESGIYVPQRALLTHFRDQFGGFTADEIEELEELLNNPRIVEKELQSFFERHPHFFRTWDYREIYPQVYLTRGKSPLIPDFILTDRELQRATIVELKRPKPKLIRRQDNRDRFGAAISEARAQLLTYRDWFREKMNREQLKSQMGMVIYEPHLAVIIGRASEFLDEYDRQKLASRHPDIEVVTYDDLVRYAERRKITIRGD
jgi:hypothetical protein